MTAKGRIEWYIDDENPQWIHANLRVGHLLLGPSKDQSGQDAVRISVFTKDGPPTLTFDDTDIHLTDDYGERVSYYPIMQNLMDDARRYAKGEDKVIDDLLAELQEKEDDIPF